MPFTRNQHDVSAVFCLHNGIGYRLSAAFHYPDLPGVQHSGQNIVDNGARLRYAGYQLTTISANSSAMAPMSGRLPLSRSRHSQRRTTIFRWRAVQARRRNAFPAHPACARNYHHRRLPLRRSEHFHTPANRLQTRGVSAKSVNG